MSEPITTKTQNSTWKGWMEGSRWAGLRSFLRREAWGFGLEINLYSETGWLSETVFFQVSGDPDSILGFQKRVWEVADRSNR